MNLVMTTDTTSTPSVPSASRRERIAAAALEVIRRRGVDGLTHRAVAAEAGVSPGLTTYHFDTLEEILEAAFDLAMERDIATLAAWSDTLDPGADLPAELTRLVFRMTEHEAEAVYVNFVLVLAAVHRPHLHGKASTWANSLTRLMEQRLSRDTSVAVATVYDGTLLRQAMTGSVGLRQEVESSFRKACGEEWQWISREEPL